MSGLLQHVPALTGIQVGAAYGARMNNDRMSNDRKSNDRKSKERE